MRGETMKKNSDTQYSQRRWLTDLLWCDNPWNKALRTDPRHILRTCTLPFLLPQEEHRRQHSWFDDFAGQCLLMATLKLQNIFSALGLRNNLEMGRSWLFTASWVKFLTRGSLKSRWVYLAPHEENIIQLLSIANNYNGLPYLFSSVWRAQFQKPAASEIWTSSTVTAKPI